MRRMKTEMDSTPSGESTQNDVSRAPHFLSETRKITWVIHLCVVFYAASHFQLIGVLPYMTRKLGVDAKMYGYLLSFFSFAQLCGGPLFGRFGDLFGGKWALVLAFFASFVSYAGLSIVSTVPLLFLSRLPTVAMHGMQGSQMIITDITNDKERAGGIGRLGIFYGIGMVFGPLLGGMIVERYNEQASVAALAFAALLCIGIIIFVIPSDTKKFSSVVEKDRATGSVFDVKKYAKIFESKNFTYMFVLKIVSGVPFGVFQAMFSLSSMEYFKLTAKQNGMVLSYVGVTTMLVQGLAMDFLTKRYSDAALIKFSILSITFANLILAFVTNVPMFLVGLFPLLCGGSIFSLVITSYITKTVPSSDTGAALGLSMATHSLIRTVAPSVGGVMYATLGFSVLGMFGFIVNGLLSVYLFLYGRQNL